MTQQPTGGVPQFTIGDRLRKARETTGMDQAAFAEHIGVSRGTVSNYERGVGEGHHKPIVLRTWAMATGVPLSWIETGIIETHPTPPDGGEALRELTEAKARRQRHARNGITRNYPASALAA